MSTLKKNFIRFTIVALLLVSTLATTNVGQVLATPIACEAVTIVGASGTIQKNWTAAPTGTACVGLTFPKEGKFVITGGWVFNAPLKRADGVTIPTRIVSGQLAPQIVPITFQVTKNQVIGLRPTWSTKGTEIGIRWQFFETRTQTVTMPAGTYLFKRVWVGNSGDVAKLVMTFPSAGTVTVSGGWTFDRSITRNGVVVPTTVKTGELAFQITPFSATVAAGEKWTWLMKMPNANAELGLYVTYSPSVHTVFLPLLSKAPQPLEVLITEVELQEGPGLQVKSAGWPQAAPSQEACVVVTFQGNAQQALLESGWMFGTSITKAELNGVSINISTLPPPPGETATQLPSLQLPNPQSLKICIVGTNPGLEIGLRIRYPNP